MQLFTIMKVILLLYMISFVENLNRSKTARNGSIFYEPISAIDIAFDEFPKLSDVLPTLVQKTSLDYDNVPGVMFKNLSIDMDKININKFRRKMDVIADMIGKDETKVNASRRQAYVDWAAHSSANYFKAADQMLRRKCLDLMLQVVYMARHKIAKLERAKHFSTKDTGFRIAYTYRMLTRIYRKMMRLYSYQARYRNYQHPHSQIILHGRVSRLHVDFCYLYWVLINVDGTYKRAKGIRKEKKKIVKMLQDQIQAQQEAQSAIKGAHGGSPGPDDIPSGMKPPEGQEATKP